MILPDIIAQNLDIVFCGTAVSNKSKKVEAYYAGTGNLFYPVLASCGFTPHLLIPQEYPSLLNYNIGLTDLAKNKSGVDSQLNDDDYDVKAFIDKILIFQPKIVCFTGKEAAKIFFNFKHTKYVNYGLQNQTINKTKLFVAPSTSAKARKYWDENIYKELKKLNNLINQI